jgi:hypothetical protein
LNESIGRRNLITKNGMEADTEVGPIVTRRHSNASMASTTARHS